MDLKKLALVAEIVGAIGIVIFKISESLGKLVIPQEHAPAEPFQQR